MAPVGLKLVLLFAVLIQYAPLRVCAVERMAVGSNCHDRDGHAVLGGPHDDEQSCGDTTDQPHECVCEQPKVDGRHHVQGAKSPRDWADVAVAATTAPMLALASNPSSLSGPDPHPRAPRALQLPLLI